MSGYKGDSNPSSLGGGVPGKFEAGFGNTMVGSNVAMNRKKLRKALNDNIDRFEQNFGSIKDYENPKFQLNFGPTAKA